MENDELRKIIRTYSKVKLLLKTAYEHGDTVRLRYVNDWLHRIQKIGYVDDETMRIIFDELGLEGLIVPTKNPEAFVVNKE